MLYEVITVKSHLCGQVVNLSVQQQDLIVDPHKPLHDREPLRGDRSCLRFRLLQYIVGKLYFESAQVSLQYDTFLLQLLYLRVLNPRLFIQRFGHIAGHVIDHVLEQKFFDLV